MMLSGPDYLIAEYQSLDPPHTKYFEIDHNKKKLDLVTCVTFVS